MTTKKEAAYLVGGIGIGVFATKSVPKMQVVKHVKFFKEVFKARGRLQKIVVEEYYRIDEAIENEEKFLNIINPRSKSSPTKISFEVEDNGEHRSIRSNIDWTRNKKA